MQKEIFEEKVFYYTNVIEDPKKLVDAIESMNSDSWSEWTACSGEHYVYGTNINIMPSVEENPLNDYIYNTINDAFHKVARDYAQAMGNNDEPKLFPLMPIKKYAAGTFMGAHFDQQEGDERLKYSLVMYLNDDYEGGEISFTIKSPEGAITGPKPSADFELATKKSEYTFAIKPKAGSVVIFPPSPPYHHTAHLVKSGFKYMVPQHWIH